MTMNLLVGTLFGATVCCTLVVLYSLVYGFAQCIFLGIRKAWEIGRGEWR